MMKSNNQILVSFICVYNNKRFFNLMLSSIKETNLSYNYEIVGIDNTKGEFKSMVAALNAAMKMAKGDVLVFLHQDIVFNKNADLNFLITKCINNIALYGVFGVKNLGKNKKSVSCITDLWSEYDGLSENQIEEVFTIDECLFACNKGLFNYIQFDNNLCRYWDFYAVDLALQCQREKIPVFSIGLKLTHYSRGNIKTKAFRAVEKELLKKYKLDFDIITYPCGWNYTNSLKTLRGKAKKTLKKCVNAMKKLVYKLLHPRKTFHKLHIFLQSSFVHLKLRFSNNSMDKKIVLVTHSSSKTGAPLLALNISKRFISAGYNVVCISLDIDGEGGLYEEFKKQSTYFLTRPSAKTMRLLKRKGYKKFLINSIASAPIIRFLDGPDIQITYLIHELPDVIMRLNLVKYVDCIDNVSNVIVFPSKFTKEKFENTFGKNKTNTIVRPQGLYQCCNIDIDKEVAKNEISKILKINPNKKILLCVGTGDKRKGVDLFYKLASKMQKHSEYVFVWIGPIYYKLDAELLNLPNVHHIQYIDNEALLYKFYRSATFYLMMSRNEPFGTIILESFNAETPVIAFDEAGGYLDILKNNETGFLVKYLNLDDYEQTILKKQKCKELNQITKNAKSLLNHFRFDDYIDFLIGTFK